MVGRTVKFTRCEAYPGLQLGATTGRLTIRARVMAVCDGYLIVANRHNQVFKVAPQNCRLERNPGRIVRDRWPSYPEDVM